MNKQRGFTILELMAIVAITAILLTIGLPSFQTMIFNNRITSQLNLFSSSLALARSEAAKVNERVVVCPSLDGLDCDVGEDFDVGWITFIDRLRPTAAVQVNDDGVSTNDPCRINSTEDCILTYVDGLVNDDMTLRSDVTGNALWYTGLGAANDAPLFVICDSRGDASAKAIAISTTGRASVRTTKTDGSALTCTP